MANTPFEVYLEIGQKRIFACSTEWPGWCRSARSEADALQALIDNAERYATAIHSAKLHFKAPSDVDALNVIERLKGNTTTDFGAPDGILASDSKPIDTAELRRYQALQDACWRSFEKSVQAAKGKELRKGPRGGGRELTEVARHVLDAHTSYLRQLAWKQKKPETQSLDQQIDFIRQTSHDALDAAIQGELPKQGPRGGTLWPPRYFIRRALWHILDHIWEIEDRVID